MRCLPGDKRYDADPLRRRPRTQRSRQFIENAFYRLKNFRRIPPHYDKLAANFLSASALATAFALCFRMSLGSTPLFRSNSRRWRPESAVRIRKEASRRAESCAKGLTSFPVKGGLGLWH